jgi:HSP20 family protein
MRWDPLQELVSWHERRYGAAGGGSGWAPPVDVYETAEGYVVVIELAGLSAGDFEVQATDESLTIRGRRGGEAGEARFIHIERGYGEFVRAFAFAERVRAAEVSAEFRDGVLTVTVPKQPASQPQRIAIAL